jgi:hypothetical protein
MRKTFLEERAMRGIIQPSRGAARMRQRDVRHAVDDARTANALFERDSSPEPIDRETAEEQDHARPQKSELLIEPWSAKRDLCRRGSPVTAADQRFSGKAFRDGRAVREVVLVDPRFLEPSPELRTGSSAEWLARRQLDRARRLPDDRDAIADGPRHDGTGTLEESCPDAFRACADASVKVLELRPVRSGHARERAGFRMSP